MTRQEEKAKAFRALHAGEAFLMPNPWDAGSARVLEAERAVVPSVARSYSK